MEVAEVSTTPTSHYEAVGGAEAMARLAGGFYDRVLADPLLLPLFADPTEPHAVRMALWLTEVFGGPPVHERDRGGLRTVISAHVGLRITERQRERWAGYMMAAARDIDMPADSEAFYDDYVQRISRVTRQTSFAGAPKFPEAPSPGGSGG